MSASKPHLPSLASLSLSSVVPIVTLKRRRGTSEIASIDEGVYQAHKDRYNKLKGYHLFSVDDLPFFKYVEMSIRSGPDMFEVHPTTSLSLSLFLTFSCTHRSGFIRWETPMPISVLSKGIDLCLPKYSVMKKRHASGLISVKTIGWAHTTGSLAISKDYSASR